MTDVEKHFGRTRALDGLSLELRQGEILGLLGPNGAGKSTAIRAILGQLKPRSGQVRVFGIDPWKHPVKAHQKLAYVPGDTALWPNLTGGECIDILARLQGTPSTRRRDQLIERFNLDPTKRARTYSKGNRQKVALVAALSTEAKLLLLDEPTSGLDPLMEHEFQLVISEAHSEGRTILLSSHILSQVEALCQRVSIVRAGQLVTTEKLEDLRSSGAVDLDEWFLGHYRSSAQPHSENQP